jgi:hypothetical protein
MKDASTKSIIPNVHYQKVDGIDVESRLDMAFDILFGEVEKVYASYPQPPVFSQLTPMNN